MIQWLKALLHAQRNKRLAESRYKELSQLRREMIEMRLERDYWMQRFQGFEAMMRQQQTAQVLPPPFPPRGVSG